MQIELGALSLKSIMLKTIAPAFIFTACCLVTPVFQSSSAVLANQQLNLRSNSPSQIALPGRDPSWQRGTVTVLQITQAQGGHDLPVRSVAFSPDGQFFASGSTDRTIKIWNLERESLERTLTQSSDQIDSIAFSPDGQWLAGGSLDGTVRIWNWQSGQLLHTLSGHSNLVTSIAFSPDSQVLASGSGDKAIQLWDVQSGTSRRKILTEQFIEAIAFSPDGAMLASTGIGKTVDLWDWSKGKLIRSLGRYAGTIYAMAFSPDGRTIAFSPDAYAATGPTTGLVVPRTERNTLQLWNLEGQPINQPLRGHTDYINAIAFSPSGQTLISGSWDRTIKIWNVQTGELISNISDILETDRRILSIAFRPDGKAFALGSGDGTISIIISNE